MYSILSPPVVSAATSARPFCGEGLLFLLFKGKLAKHANRRMRLDALARNSRYRLQFNMEALVKAADA